LERKELILKHLRENKKVKFDDFRQIFPNLTRYQIHYLLKSLKKEKKIEFVSEKGKIGYWHLTK
jgi:predicted HTH transcriptional regulator